MIGQNSSKLWTWFFPAAVIAAICGAIGWAVQSPLDRDASRSSLPQQPGPTPGASSAETVGSDIGPAVGAVDRLFAEKWQPTHGPAAQPASALQVLRRLSLSLCGTIPSLEEIRIFESDASPDRLDRWTKRLLSDSRFADYFAERLARSFVGAEGGQFIVFRRDRFVDWLRRELANHTPYDELARKMISETGLWTDRPATNYITVALADGKLDENKLAGRTVRAFLGQRIDCAQCHDHPFAEWKQPQFQGLASMFGQTRTSLVGVEDQPKLAYEVEDRKTLKKHVVEPGVPFHPEWLPAAGTRRQRLAAWVTHPDNRRFERAAVNRIWGLLFAKPFHSPVDDLPDPPDGSHDLLDQLGADFRMHHCDLQRLIRVIAASQTFRLDSAEDSSKPKSAPSSSSSEADDVTADWAVFPMSRLRPEQLIGSMLQASSLRTIDQNSHLFVRAQRFFQGNEFVKQYGDLGENELDERAATISQALLRMNGKLAADVVQASPFNATSRIASFAATDRGCLETCFLVALTRRATQAEADHFLPQLALAGPAGRPQVVEDLFWTLFNSPEFSWSH